MPVSCDHCDIENNVKLLVNIVGRFFFGIGASKHLYIPLYYHQYYKKEDLKKPVPINNALLQFSSVEYYNI